MLDDSRKLKIKSYESKQTTKRSIHEPSIWGAEPQTQQ